MVISRSVARRRPRGAGALAVAFALTLFSSTTPQLTQAIGPYELQISTAADRSNPDPLQGATVSGTAYVFLSPETADIDQVVFFLDDPTMSGAPFRTEGNAPYDFAGGPSGGATANGFDTTTLANGSHTISARVDLVGGGTEQAAATFTVSNAGPATLAFSPTSLTFGASVGGANMSQTATVSLSDGSSAAFTATDNRSWMSVAPTSGTTPASLTITARPGTKAAGTYTGSVTATTASGTSASLPVTMTLSATSLVFSPSSLAPTAESDADPVALTTELTASDASALSFTVSDDQPWLTLAPTSGTTPATLTVTADPDGLAPGVHNGTVTATSGTLVKTLGVAFTVTAPPSTGCTDISPLPCSQVMVPFPYTLNFGADAGKIDDKDGLGTGFSMVDPPTNGVGYIPANLDLNTNSPGTLAITTTAGLQHLGSNSLDNGLGVGIDAPDHVSLMSGTLVNPPVGSGQAEQAGLWFGNDENNYLKFVVLSTATGTKIQFLMEVNGAQTDVVNSGNINLVGDRVKLTLRANPADRTITASYKINALSTKTLGTFVAPGGFFSFDAAGIDPTIGTNTFGGLMASHRNGASPLTYVFDEFSLKDDTPPAPVPPTGFSFARSTYPIDFPTSMVFGPDGRLYVSEMMGKIHALTLSPSNQVTADQVINTIANMEPAGRLTLGLAIDPASTATNVILYVAHSDPDLAGPNDQGVGGAPANTSMVSRLSGTTFTTKVDVITGLPRSQANHSTNSIHFGPDGKLYIAQGGNTGAGAPNDAPDSLAEFGSRAEQPLSAALLVADIKAAGFDGSCDDGDADIYDAPACDVATYATGLRNAYDFAWHTNGKLYAPDNGLGVTGTYPPSPSAPCPGSGDVRPFDQGGDNPGDQPDLLFRIQPGKYYGHPNPSRGECVFKDGSYQGVAPLPHWEGAIRDLGNKKSANGTIEYRGAAFGGVLRGNLLITNYSVGDDITRVVLSSDGNSVLSTESLVGGFKDPLPLVEAPNGAIIVGEFGANQVSILAPSVGAWTTRTSAPAAILDAGSAALNGKLYMVAGKTSAGPTRTMYSYDPAAGTNGSWATQPSLPAAYAAVENPAVVSYSNKLYVFGGSTAAFTGAVTNAAVFDPALGTWTMLPAMPVARGGATAQVIGNKIYVAGGLDGPGASLSSVSVLTIPASGTPTWSTAAAMSTRRDNPGSAVLDGKLYVFGGRTRNADGTTINGTLATVEMYDPATNTWTARAPMPTGRRTVVVGTLFGKAQVIGGERTAAGGTFPQVEEFDPVANSWRSLTSMKTPRHGSAAGTINNTVYVAAGGPNGGSSFSTVNESFTYAP